MATRRGRYVDPSKIPDAETWIKYYTARYANLKIRGSDGSYLVYDPVKLSEDFEKTMKEEPAKVIKVRKGYDAIVYANYGTDKELRDEAGEKIRNVKGTYFGSFEQLTKEYKGFESELFLKVTEYRASDDKITKAKLAKEIAILQKKLAEKDEERYDALYPVRLFIDRSFEAKYVNPAIKSDSNIAVSILSNIQTKLTDRVLEKKPE